MELLASLMFLKQSPELFHYDFIQRTRTKIQKPSILLEDKKYPAAGKQFLIIWQDVQTEKQDLYSNYTFVLWDSDMATSNNEASVLIKELEELGVSLIRDAAMAFYLAVDEPFEKDNIRRYDNESSPWPKLGSGIKHNGKTIEKGTGIDLVLENMKHPLDKLLEDCTTNRDVADMLSYYYFSKSRACDIDGYYSADVECIMGQSSRLAKEKKQEMLEQALQRASGNSDIGNKEWIEECLHKLRDP
ncbi:hypothetical protein V491_06522 [Pseudogymnoascus sp. VKM F-3775]|nr:hypothetical protein V491_06522 [Pseudogymnoascus sp. VKM F-3775]